MSVHLKVNVKNDHTIQDCLPGLIRTVEEINMLVTEDELNDRPRIYAQQTEPPNMKNGDIWIVTE